MKVNSIQLNKIGNYSHPSTMRKQNYISFGSVCDKTEFKTNKKEPICVPFKGLFSRKNKPLSPEIQKSEEIKSFLGNLSEETMFLKKFGKRIYSKGKNYLEVGSYSDFEGFVDYDKKQGLKLIFSQREGNNPLPSSFTLYKYDGSFTKMSEFDLFGDGTLDSLYKYTEYEYDNGDEIETTYLMRGKNILSKIETNKTQGTVSSLQPEENTRDCFHFSVQDSNDETIIDCKLDPVINGKEDSYYQEKSDSGKLITYKFDVKTNTWLAI